MWTVFEERHVSKQLDKAPKEIQAKFEKWKDTVVNQGPQGLLLIKGFRDHALSGQWNGARSSSLNYQWRVIYAVIASEVKILVMEVTPHDYRKKS
jgi:proteic killer suppression protein